MNDKTNTSILTSNLAVAHAAALTMGPATITHKALPAAISTSIFVTFETETVTFHPGGSVVHTPPVPTTLVTTTATSSAPESTTGSGASQTGTQGPKSAVIGGAVGATIFTLLMIGLVAFCLLCRRRRELQGTRYSPPTPFPAHGGRPADRGSDGGLHRLENIPLASLAKTQQISAEQHQAAARGDETGPSQMRIEVVPAANGDRGPRLRTVWVPPAVGSAPHPGRNLLPPHQSPGAAAPAPYPTLEVPRPAPARPLRNASSSVYSQPSRENVTSRFSEYSDVIVNSDSDNENENENENGNENDSRTTVWPAPLFSSGSPAQAAPPAAAGAPVPLSSTTTSYPESADRGGPSQSSTYVEPPSQSRWSPDTPFSDGSQQNLTTRVQAQVAQVGAKLADTWKEKKEKLGSLLGSSSKEEKNPSREDKGKGKARNVEILVDPVNRGAPGWI